MSTKSAAYNQLAGLLTKAAAVIDSLLDLNIYVPYDTQAEFSAHVRKLATRVDRQEHAALRELIPIFAPTGAWDDAIGFEGMDIANRIMFFLDQLNWSAEKSVEADPCPPGCS
jgi:hypothetical protein